MKKFFILVTIVTLISGSASSFKAVYDGPVKPSSDELDGGRFWTMKEIEDALGKGILTPNFESEFRRFF